MVLAYWLIGREIVVEVQRGKDRAKYGEQLLENLSKQLMERFESSFSIVNLQWFRKFFLAYRERIKIPYPPGTELAVPHQNAQRGSDSSMV